MYGAMPFSLAPLLCGLGVLGASIPAHRPEASALPL